MNRRGEGNNAAIVAIVVLAMAGIFAFFLMSGGDGDGASDIKVNIEKPAAAVGDAAKGVGEAAKEAVPGE